MTHANTVYAGDDTQGFYRVNFIVNASGVKLTRAFDSEYMARKFANKVKFSKNTTLVSCVGFIK